MATGKIFGGVEHSPIVDAIAVAEAGTTGEIRVHLSKRLFEKNPFKHASRLFEQFGMTRTSQRNAVLLYVNLRRRKFALVADEGIQKVLIQRYWDDLAKALKQNLRETHPERAIASAVIAVGIQLKRHFPAEAIQNPEGKKSK
jgi:uncharacterized membrane protein